MASRPQPESAVLAPRDPFVDINSDEWPEFQLTNVRVRVSGEIQADGTTSLLLACEHYPLTVTGELQPLSKDLSHLYLQPSTKRTTPIELPEVRSFAYGQYEDNSVAIWAAGQAGWFTIKPSRAYKSVYSDMVEAVNMLYFVADAYKEPRVRGKGKSATPLGDLSATEFFEKYARDCLDGSVDAAEAAKKIYKHRDFLMASMIMGKENITWDKKPIYMHLRKKFVAEHQAIVQRLASSPKQTSRQRSTGSNSTANGGKRKRGRPRKDQDMDVISLGSSSLASISLEDVPKQHQRASGPRLVQTRPITAPNMRTNSSAALTEASMGAHAGGGPAQRTRHHSSATLTQPLPQAPAESESTTTPTREESEDDEVLPFARKRKSVLRPKAAKASKGAHPGRGASPDDAECDQEVLDHLTSPTAGKRKLDEDGEPRPSKRRNSQQEVDEGIDMPSSPDAPSPDTMSGAMEEPSHDLAVRLHHRPDAIQEDTWICALDGCPHKVYRASQPESQGLIREHYALHAYDDDSRMQLVRRLRAPSLPVNHLMEKVRLQAKLEGFPGSKVAGTRFPAQPHRTVVQRY